MFLYSPVAVFCFLVLPQAAHSQQQPYNDWDSAYKAAEELVSSWTFEQIANVTVRNGQAPGYLPFTATDGMISVYVN
jgi:beta-glucosidase